MAEQVAVLVDRATLNGQVAAPERHERGLEAGSAVDDHEFRPPQASRIQIAEELAPGCRAFSAHVSDREQHLLSVAADADRRQHRNIGSLAVQPSLDDGAIEDEPDNVLLGQTAGGTRASQSTFTLRPGPG